MSIETEITRISTNVSDTLSAVSEMGGEVPEGATSDDMASGVRSIPVGAKINDTTPSSTTTYSSQKIESELTALNDANAALIEVSKTEPNTENTELWIHPNADEVQLPQINDSVESVQDTWSSKKIAAEVSKKANDADLAVVAKSGSYNDLTNKPTIPTVPSTLPNPNKLILSGAVTAEYDGSAEVNVEIPAGGSGSYTLPVASPTTLGGVKAVAATDEMTDDVGITAEGLLKVKPGGGGSNVEGVTTVLASGSIASGTAAMAVTDTGVSYDEFLKHKLVLVYVGSTVNGTPEYSFRNPPTATWHLNNIGIGRNSGNYTIFEPIGKLLGIKEAYSGAYSTIGGDTFGIGDYNVDTLGGARFTYKSMHNYQGGSTMKIVFQSELTADWNWKITALD